MINRKMLDKLYEELHETKALICKLESCDTFLDVPGVLELHNERILAATTRYKLIDLLLDIYICT